tara:strand:- start:2592 stop:3143 length:552 start_codon:yes stop_codon:yes gene_type:complete
VFKKITLISFFCFFLVSNPALGEDVDAIYLTSLPYPQQSIMCKDKKIPIPNIPHASSEKIENLFITYDADRCEEIIDITLENEPNCYRWHHCEIGGFNVMQPPPEIMEVFIKRVDNNPKAKKVALAENQYGYFSISKCTPDCTFSSLAWFKDDFMYMLSMKPDEKDEDMLIQAATKFLQRQAP